MALSARYNGPGGRSLSRVDSTKEGKCNVAGEMLRFLGGAKTVLGHGPVCLSRFLMMRR